MWILALDTSTREGSVAVMLDGRVVATTTGDPSRTHGERLPGDLLAIVGKAGLSLSAVDRFAVSAGPGSFTSLRVGLATIQALALVHSRPVAQVSTLEALARTPGAGERVLAWMDGQRRDVFAALYDRGAREVYRRPASRLARGDTRCLEAATGRPGPGRRRRRGARDARADRGATGADTRVGGRAAATRAGDRAHRVRTP